MTDDEKYPYKPKVGDIIEFVNDERRVRVTDVFDYGNANAVCLDNGDRAVFAWNYPGISALDHFRKVRKPIIVISTE